MYKLLLRFWEWVCSHDKVRHCICVFFTGSDPKWDGDGAKIGEDLRRYWQYTDDPEHADPELREFALNMQKVLKLDDRIRLIRSIFNWVFMVVGIMLVLLFCKFLEYVIEAVRQLRA